MRWRKKEYFATITISCKSSGTTYNQTLVSVVSAAGTQHHIFNLMLKSAKEALENATGIKTPENVAIDNYFIINNNY